MDAKHFETQLLTMQGELQQIKSTLTPCIIFLNDLLEVRKKRNISESTPHTLLSLITLEIKSEIMREVNPRFVMNDQLDAVRDVIADNHQEHLTLKQIALKTEEDVKAHQATLGYLDFQSKDNGGKIEELRYQLESKASVSHFQELRHLIKGCATISSFETMKNRISECAGKYQLDEIQKTQFKLDKKLKKYPKTTEVNDMLTVLKDEIKYLTDKDYINKENYSKEKEGMIKKMKFSEDRITELTTRAEKNEGYFSKKVAAVKKQLDSAPWSPSISEIHNVLLEKATYDDIEKFKAQIDVIINNDAHMIESYKRSIISFETILARFDEILLIKAEKDEITRINQKIETLVEKIDYNSTIETINTTIQRIHDAIKKLIQSGDIMDKHIDSIGMKCNNLIKDYIDVSIVAKSLQDLKEIVESKANKVDIYEIYDTMGRKLDVKNLFESSGVQKKQLELCAVLLFSLCRTLLKNGENPNSIQKKREELLTSLNSLVNWICGNAGGVGKIGIKPEMLHKECSSAMDDRCRSTGAKSLYRRNSLSSKKDQRLIVDFPKQKLL